MKIPRHASIRSLPVAGTLPPVVAGQTLPVSERVPALPCCGDAELSIVPFGSVRPLRPWFVVNPGGGAAAPRASWLQSSGANNVKVKFIPNDKTSDNASDFRIQAPNGLEVGAAWKKVSQAERPYVSVSQDDPSFPATVYARLIEGEDGTHNLIWSRSKGD